MEQGSAYQIHTPETQQKQSSMYFLPTVLLFFEYYKFEHQLLLFWHTVLPYKEVRHRISDTEF